MLAKIGVFDSHEQAIAAVECLKSENFPINHVSVIGRLEIIDNHISVKSLDSVKNAPIAIGAVAGVVTGILTGLGVFAIPGFGFLYGAGAIIGLLGGLDIGIIGGGLMTILTHLGIKDEDVIRYDQHIRDGRFLVVVQGKESEVERARKILSSKNIPFQLKK